MNKTWFTSDLHHSHKNIVKFTNRGVETTQEKHDEWLEYVWNSQVKPGDLVYHLGDYSFAKRYEDIANFTRKLNGQKIFLKGNHDKRETLNQLVNDGLIQQWYDYKEIKVEEQAVVLFHFPIMSWHKQGHGSWHLHGHSHGNLQDSRGKMLDVGIDNWYNEFGQCVDIKSGYCAHNFFHWEDVKQLMDLNDFHIADSHRENI